VRTTRHKGLEIGERLQILRRDAVRGKLGDDGLQAFDGQGRLVSCLGRVRPPQRAKRRTDAVRRWR